MLKMILFLTLIIALFQKQLWWLGLRLSDNDGWSCYLGIAISILFIFKNKKDTNIKKYNFYFLSICLIFFCLTIEFMPHIIQCLFILFILYTGFCLCLGKAFHFHIILLLCFCLPWLDTFQFYLGYPLRMICSHGAIVFFNLINLPVELKGVLFSYQGQTVYIDAPCSGIKMLYIGLLFAVILCNLFELSFKKTVVFLGSTFLMILVTNVFRYIILFFGEAGFFYMPEWLHSGFGLILFFLNNIICFYLINNYEIVSKYYNDSISFIKNLSFRKGHT
jgi:exosortase/archaeosortase family protein